MSSKKILFVDDEPNVLRSMERQLRKKIPIKTALSGDDALRILKEEGPFAVIVSDMRMPGMDGVQLLSHAKDLYPEMVRMMLTGNADQATAMEAVNTGHIFRFLTKPCATATLITSLALALKQNRLVVAEKELLNKTLKGSINVLSELLSLANPTAFSAGYRIKEMVKQLTESMGLKQAWQYEVAALMSQIGCVTLPKEILQKVQGSIKLSDEEYKAYSNHPNVGCKLVKQIPRLEKVAGMIENQMYPYSYYFEEGEEIPDDIQIGAQILKVAITLDKYLYLGEVRSVVLDAMRKQQDVYNPAIVVHLSKIKTQYEVVKVVNLKFEDILPGMVADDDVYAKNGTIIIPKGQEISWPMILGLENYLKNIGIKEPIRVRITEQEEPGELPI